MRGLGLGSYDVGIAMLRFQGLRVRFGVLNLPFALFEAPCEDCGSFGFALASLCRFRKPGDPASVPGFGSNLPAPATNLNKPLNP